VLYQAANSTPLYHIDVPSRETFQIAVNANIESFATIIAAAQTQPAENQMTPTQKNNSPAQNTAKQKIRKSI